MVQDSVLSSAHVPADPTAVWAVLRDFCSPWHPAIATVQSHEGGQVRAFTVVGEDTLYRERLTWFSDSERAMAYTHLSGIKGASSYNAMLSVEPSRTGGTVVSMSANIEALPERLAAISDGTRTIFEAGLKSLSGRTFDVGKVEARAEPVPSALTSRSVKGSPRLVHSETPLKDGPLCIFLHGIGGNRSNWTQQLQSLGKVMQGVALDLRGYGDSDLGEAQSTLDDYCDDLVRLRDAFGSRKLVLCGLSYGAWIATSFAERNPDLVAGLVLAGGCTGMSEASTDVCEAFRTSRETPLDQGQTPADFADAVIRTISGPNASPETLHALTNSMAAISAETYRDAIRCFTNPPRKFDFSRLDMPVLMMTGEYDTLAPPSEIKSVACRIHAESTRADVRFEVIKGAGHVCNVEDPDAFNVPLQEFLGRLVS